VDIRGLSRGIIADLEGLPDAAKTALEKAAAVTKVVKRISMVLYGDLYVEWK
jgi:hypothetical protein